MDTTTTQTGIIVKLTGMNSNALDLLGAASKALKEAGHHDEAIQLANKVFECKTYREALSVISKYVLVE